MTAAGTSLKPLAAAFLYSARADSTIEHLPFPHSSERLRLRGYFCSQRMGICATIRRSGGLLRPLQRCL